MVEFPIPPTLKQKKGRFKTLITGKKAQNKENYINFFIIRILETDDYESRKGGGEYNS